MPGEHADDLGLSAVEEIKRCSLETMDRFRCEAEKRFSETCMLNEAFGFLNPHALLRSKNIKDIFAHLAHPLAPFCCVLRKDTLRYFPLLGGLDKQF